MPVLEMFGPSRGHPFMPSASAPGELSAAARKYGVKPMPALEWNAEVERETAHLEREIQELRVEVARLADALRPSEGESGPAGRRS